MLKNVTDVSSQRLIFNSEEDILIEMQLNITNTQLEWILCHRVYCQSIVYVLYFKMSRGMVVGYRMLSLSLTTSCNRFHFINLSKLQTFGIKIDSIITCLCHLV